MAVKDAAIHRNIFWGRRNAVSPTAGVKTASVLVLAPTFVLLLSASLKFFDGSISKLFEEIWTHGVLNFLDQYFPKPGIEAGIAYGSWLAFQALLYTLLPGKVYNGQPTPGGYILKYNINGLSTFFVTILVFVWAGMNGTIDLTWIARHFQDLIVAGNVFGVLLSLVMYGKACVAPTKTRDTRFSGSFLHDLFAGCELNPRWGEDFDIKLFHVGRPGMNAWVVVDISFAALQWQEFGYVTNSMVIAMLLHTIYVIDFFYNEDWYLKTIDIHHDHFGFYFAWGSAVWLPVIYTMQAQYLAYHPVDLSPISAATTLAIGLGGYALFRSANHQKYLARETGGECRIWGSKAEVINCTYKTSDGVVHSSLLLCSGWWGAVRHANYVGDMMIAFAASAACGFTHLLPWGYFFYLSGLLIHRCVRDEKRCLDKYGDDWKVYCRKVRWTLVPYLF